MEAVVKKWNDLYSLVHKFKAKDGFYFNYDGEIVNFIDLKNEDGSYDSDVMVTNLRPIIELINAFH